MTSNDYAKPHYNIMLRSSGEFTPFPLHIPKLAGKRTINHQKTMWVVLIQNTLCVHFSIALTYHVSRKG